MTEPVWVLPEAVLAIHQILLAEHGGPPGIRDHALLDSALARPRQRIVYDEEATIFELAASYGFGLIKNHPFVDGNKRVALTIAALFLALNGHSLDASEAEAVVIHEQLASGMLSEESLADWFRDSSVSLA
ncbi:MAG: type II toxin-antitoxin system death-on-curing family toxin [Candidatus Thiodiazotropha sp. (ex Dulcina madagascariensis)]|nr:type II toxin-antitoxin system death-on-curing family toxin [Candidatus Thiodiazotropha sp. (ex Dulcina madagascariensis)]